MNNQKQLLINCIDALVRLRDIFEFAPDQYRNELGIINKALKGDDSSDDLAILQYPEDEINLVPTEYDLPITKTIDV